jgi:hypothetical protein
MMTEERKQPHVILNEVKDLRLGNGGWVLSGEPQILRCAQDDMRLATATFIDCTHGPAQEDTASRARA